MIQRPQSIFLLLASLGFFSLFKIPFVGSNKVVSPLFEDQVYNIFDFKALLVIAACGGLVSLVAIFLFNNRKLQRSIAFVCLALAVVLMGLSFWVLLSNNFSIGSADLTNKAGLSIPLVSAITALLASVFINKDEKLVKSMDRLR